jgi:hypothetical protein
MVIHEPFLLTQAAPHSSVRDPIHRFVCRQLVLDVHPDEFERCVFDKSDLIFEYTRILHRCCYEERKSVSECHKEIKAT